MRSKMHKRQETPSTKKTSKFGTMGVKSFLKHTNTVFETHLIYHRM